MNNIVQTFETYIGQLIYMLWQMLQAIKQYLAKDSLRQNGIAQTVIYLDKNESEQLGYLSNSGALSALIQIT